MKKNSGLFTSMPVLLAAMLALTAACGPAQVAPEQPKAGVPAAATKASPGDSWDELVKAAQKEGTVTIYGTTILPVIVPLREAFKKKYGIDLEFVTGVPAEIAAKIMGERKAGLFIPDVVHIGETIPVMEWKPAGITTGLDNLLVLPEVKNPQNWTSGNLLYLEKDHHVVVIAAIAYPQTLINTDLVKEGAFSSFLDLTKPEWREKIILNDPSVTGIGNPILAAMYKTFGKERALEIFRQLAANKPLVTRDNRLLLEWVARGKYPLAIGQSMGLYPEFKRAQAPIRLVSLKEPRHISSGASTITVINNNPHPKATQLYVNWLLTREGSTIWSKALELASPRVDVPREGLEPETVPRAGDYFPDEEQLQLRIEMRKVAVDVFGALMK